MDKKCSKFHEIVCLETKKHKVQIIEEKGLKLSCARYGNLSFKTFKRQSPVHLKIEDNDRHLLWLISDVGPIAGVFLLTMSSPTK